MSIYFLLMINKQIPNADLTKIFFITDDQIKKEQRLAEAEVVS